MKAAEIVVGDVYLAYVGSLARVLVLATDESYHYPTGGKTRGIRVRTLQDVRLAIDPRMIWHREGDEFVIPSKLVARKEEA